MRRLHFYIMGLISLAYGLLVMTEYVLISYGLQKAWLEFYSEAQIAWFEALPDWVHGVWGAHATLALVGALCLLAHLRPAVWMLFFSFFTLLVLVVWATLLADPSMLSLVGSSVMAWATSALVLALSFLIYLYARHEKQLGEVL
ncbi:hypothetical protein [Jannaschia marina]|uniref:hypothetical protein n=1 Tax=Jannaschia marina TaxID=2741674 RepID=UPI0015CB4AD5|nr:hypothetical protein [Jannaschia marina]